ncbi:MAG TPA: type II toxin-antitoxin system antitoxin SocA domain-containing protein [Acidimicrobiales bacterium]
MDVTYDERKFRELVLYVAERLRHDTAGGTTKQVDALYFAEFAHVRRTGRPISGAEYHRLGRAPVPRRLLPVRRELLESGDAELVRVEFLGHEQRRLQPRRAADRSVLADDEVATVEAVLGDLAPLSGRQVGELAQEEPAWRLCSDGETIPHAAALIAQRQVSTATARRLGAEVARRYGVDGAR